jgi:hypothetical protein
MVASSGHPTGPATDLDHNKITLPETAFPNLTFRLADHGGSRLHRAMYPSPASLGTSTVTRIETFLFTKLNLSQAAPFLANVRYGNQSVSIEVISFPDQK